jgi:glycosyltransferase involved in cell wall biosynthesis
MREIVIVSYTFPPMGGVGGRRWSKLANALTELGVKVHVFCAAPNSSEHSPWQIYDSVIVHRFPRKYPQILNRVPKSLFEKLQYRFWLWALKFFTKGNYYDRGIFWRNYIAGVYNFMQHHSMRNLVVTGGPFSLLYQAAAMKSKYPEIHLISDIRDEWGADAFYGFGLLGNKRRLEEMRRLEFTLQHSDTIVVPYPYMKRKYTQIAGENAAAISILPHGVDDVFYKGSRNPKPGAKICLVNFGSIHSGQEKPMQDLAQVLSRANIQISFYTTETKYSNVFEAVKAIPENVSYHPPVAEAQVVSILQKSHAALLFIPPHFKDSITTKFMEIVATRTPIVAVGTEGEASEFIIKNRLGLFIPYGKITSGFMSLHSDLDNLDYNGDFDTEPFHFRNQAKQVLQLFEKSIN